MVLKKRTKMTQNTNTIVKCNLKYKYIGKIPILTLKMHRRNRNIILFFEENENARNISSKMVRFYMNRFIIEEEQRFEITGVFKLAKVPKITAGRGDRRLRNVSTRNWNEDRQLIKGAFEKLEIFTLLSTDIHIFMGTSLYLDVMNHNDSLNELVRNLGEKCSSSTTISMTLLSGENHELHKKNDVQNVYREKWFQGKQGSFFNLFGERLNTFHRYTSLNDDLENIFSDMISTNTHLIAGVGPNSEVRRRWLIRHLITGVRNLFLYEMQSEDDIKTRPDLIRKSDDHQYLLSLCKVITVHLK